MLALKPTQTQTEKPTSSAAALNSGVTHIPMLLPASGTLKPGCKERLSRPLTLSKTHYLNTTHMHLVSLAELIIQSQKHSSVKSLLHRDLLLIWVLTECDELVTSWLRHWMEGAPQSVLQCAFFRPCSQPEPSALSQPPFWSQGSGPGQSNPAPPPVTGTRISSLSSYLHNPVFSGKKTPDCS